jgi:hypothetical protein
MPQILVVADNHDGRRGKIVLRERVVPNDLASEHFSAQLVERVGWALVDADEVENPAASADRTNGLGSR